MNLSTSVSLGKSLLIYSVRVGKFGWETRTKFARICSFLSSSLNFSSRPKRYPLEINILSIQRCLLLTYVNSFYFTVFEAENLGDNPDKNCQKQASNYNDDTLVRSEDFGAQQSQYSTHSTEVRSIFFPFCIWFTLGPNPLYIFVLMLIYSE